MITASSVVVASIASENLYEEIRKKVLPYFLVSKGFNSNKSLVKEFEFNNVVTHDGKLIESFKLLLNITTAVKTDEEIELLKGRGGYNAKSKEIKIRVLSKYVDNDEFYTYVPRSSIRFSAYCSTLIHEVVHAIDDSISKYDDLFLSTRETEEDKIANYNMPGEYRGLLNQLLYQIETRAKPKLEAAVSNSIIKSNNDALRLLDIENPAEFLEACKNNKLFDLKLDKKIKVLTDKNKKHLFECVSRLRQKLLEKYVPASFYTGASA
jgi:hypothetical protein